MGTARTDGVQLVANQEISNVSAALWLPSGEVCGNGVDDDGDGRIDDADSDCTTCVVQTDVACGDPYRHFIAPAWEMLDYTGLHPSGFSYDTVPSFTGPGYLILTTNASSTQVSIRTPDGSAFNRTVTVTRDGELRVPIPRSAMQTAAENTVAGNKGLVVESEQPVNAVYYIDGFFNKALVTMKGEQALDNRFYAGSQTAQHPCITDLGVKVGEYGVPRVVEREAHFVSVIATEDDTRVTFEWRTDSTTYAELSGGRHTVTLDAGESYLIRDDYTNQTFSGTRVTSDKAISVISGSQHTNVCDNGGMDAGIDPLVPECYVGTEYVAVKHQGNDNQHYVVVVPTQDGTEVRVNGQLVGRADALSYLDVPIAGHVGKANLISTSAPAYVYHVSGISFNNEVGMALAASFGECRGNKYLAFASPELPANALMDLNVILRTDALGSLRLNDTVIYNRDASVYYGAVEGRPDITSVVIPRRYVRDVNTLRADGYFQAGLLIGISGQTGTYGYLTRFGESIQVLEPGTGAPVPSYDLGTVCGGDTFEHTVEVLSCDPSVEIVSADYNTDPGTLTLTDDLTFRYEAKSAAYGGDQFGSASATTTDSRPRSASRSSSAALPSPLVACPPPASSPAARLSPRPRPSSPVSPARWPCPSPTPTRNQSATAPATRSSCGRGRRPTPVAR